MAQESAFGKFANDKGENSSRVTGKQEVGRWERIGTGKRPCRHFTPGWSTRNHRS